MARKDVNIHALFAELIYSVWLTKQSSRPGIMCRDVKKNDVSKYKYISYYTYGDTHVLLIVTHHACTMDRKAPTNNREEHIETDLSRVGEISGAV